MVFILISYLLLVSAVCFPFSIRVKFFSGDKYQPLSAVININSLINIFPGKKDKTAKAKMQAKKKPKKPSPLKLRFNPDQSIFNLIKIYEMKIVCHNISKYSTIGYNMAINLLQQVVFFLKYKDCLYDFNFVNTVGDDNIPEIQLKLHIKINLFIIFSSIFKIIKIEKRRVENESR